MKRFKTFFYGIYLLFFFVCLFIAFQHENMVLRWDWNTIDKWVPWEVNRINTWIGLIRLVLKLGGIGLALLGIEIVVENIHLFVKNRKIKKLEKEVVEIKARLYDQSQQGSHANDIQEPEEVTPTQEPEEINIPEEKEEQQNEQIE